MKRQAGSPLTKAFLIAGLTSCVVFAGCGKQTAAQPPSPHSEFSPTQPGDAATPPDYTSNQQDQILKLYAYIDPSHVIDEKLLHEAELFFHANKSKFKNISVMTVIDYALNSAKKRFYLIDLSSGQVWSTYVAHGHASDENFDGYADFFSNAPNSRATSLGAYRTAETYTGDNGYSLRLDGLSPTDSNARDRAIVVHGASYVHDAPVVQGRSFGCPALPLAYYKQVIDQIKEGSLIYAGLSTKPTSAVAQN